MDLKPSFGDNFRSFNFLKKLVVIFGLFLGFLGSLFPILGNAQIANNEFATIDTFWITPSSRVVFSPSLSDSLVFGTQDLKITTTMANNIASCRVKVRRYFTKDAWTDLVATSKDKVCEGVFKKEQQSQWFYEGVILITDTNGQSWMKFIQPAFGRGSFSFVEMKAELVRDSV